MMKLHLAALSAAILITASPARPASIDFNTFSGPSLFVLAGDAQTLNITTGIGIVTFQGGVILSNATNSPANSSPVYATAGNAESLGVVTGNGFTNPIVITFPSAITNLFLDVYNGLTTDILYRVEDNAGNLAEFLIPANLAGGYQTIGFAATGTEVTVTALTGVTTPSGVAWDFLVDNVTFNEALPPGLDPVPEPWSGSLIGAGLIFLFVKRRTHP